MASSSTQDPSEPPKTPRPIFIPHWRWRRPRLPASAPATATTPHAVFIPHRRRRRPGLPAPSSSRIGTGGGPALSLYRTGAALDSLPHRRRPRFPAMSPSCIGTASARGIATGRQGGSARNRRWRWQPGFELGKHSQSLDPETQVVPNNLFQTQYYKRLPTWLPPSSFG
ncbi:hypothetical protein SETIT_2G294700v2 [Setaria italica]|uniref:Uncharacterized protein n=1 Tax=Setaria italica TaxID=4555 RepID=A0A368Q438_SETIT|nr:hypothetical protein SETIT_2G294700v2 [Setaria italica]RCV12766.1 hypothetical protein SETIT_2G294700v2 [Setaria italica]RCV12767.1 hypothetical protein SETIT_2G294700v2 [Setaria italica]RCV12768.1 hypothetical protein SETIT_2G294700v2 [Setaria italica]